MTATRTRISSRRRTKLGISERIRRTRSRSYRRRTKIGTKERRTRRRITRRRTRTKENGPLSFPESHLYGHEVLATAFLL